MKRTLLLLALVIGGGCNDSTAPDRIHVTGTVRHFTFEGGFWAIRGDDSTTYDPISGVPADFQTEGLRVILDAKPRPDLTNFHAAGPIVEIITLRRVVVAE